MLLAVLIAITDWLLSLFMPWWSAFIPGFIFGAIMARGRRSSFLWGFAGMGGVWLIQTLYINIANNGILAARIATLFNLPYPFLLIIITIAVGGLIGGLTALTGYLFRNLFVG